MKFINVSNENMAITKGWVEPNMYYKKQTLGLYYDDWDGMTLEITGPDSFNLEGGCCFDDGPGKHVMWLSDYWKLSEEDDEKFCDWFCGIDNSNYTPDMTWDFALNEGTEYKNG